MTVGQRTADRYKVSTGGPADVPLNQEDRQPLEQLVSSTLGLDVVSDFDDHVDDARYSSILYVHTPSPGIDLRVSTYVDDQTAQHDYQSSTESIMERYASIERLEAPVEGATMFTTPDHTIWVSFLRGRVRVAMSLGASAYKPALGTRLAAAIDDHLTPS